jgi:hypothetical protein
MDVVYCQASATRESWRYMLDKGYQPWYGPAVDSDRWVAQAFVKYEG